MSKWLLAIGMCGLLWWSMASAGQKVAVRSAGEAEVAYDTATFGYGGASSDFYEAVDDDCLSTEYASDHFTASTGDSIITVGLKANSDVTGGNAYIALYTVSGGRANTKVSVSGAIAFVAAAKYDSVTVAWPLTDGITYCLASGEYTGSGWNQYFGGTGTNGATWQAAASFPTTWGSNDGTTNERLCLYATYVSLQ